MLRCGIAAKEIARGGRTVSSYILLAAASAQASCSYASRRSYSRRVRRRPSQLEISERQTLQDIRHLKADLDSVQKEKEAQDANVELGKISEATLDTIYEALQAPDPPSEEEIRLEARRRRRRQDKLEGGRQRDYIDTYHGKKTISRLARLAFRLRRYDVGLATPSITSSAYERTSFLLDRLGVVEGVEEERADGDDTAERFELDGGGNEEESDLLVFHDGGQRNAILDQIERISESLAKRPSGSLMSSTSPVPLGVATSQEWEALAVSFAYHKDMIRVRRVLEAAQKSGHFTSLSKAANAALDVYANGGGTAECKELIQWMDQNGILKDDHTSHCLIKSCIRDRRYDEALAILNDLEDQQPASLSTYTFVLASLMQEKGDQSLQQMVWPLFNRMRLVAHPIPDAPCYATMIKACALGIIQANDNLWKPSHEPLPNDASSTKITRQGIPEPDAERALDLFREMTDRYGIRPSAEVYSALILTCAKRKDMYDKALQLFRTMIELELARLAPRSRGDKREEMDSPSYAPTREVFNAVLSGCAKNADLVRARWILAEMLRSAAVRWQEIMSQKGEGAILADWEVQDFEDRLPNTETLSKVFYTYASYKTPKRHMAVKKDSTTSTSAPEIASTGEDVASIEEGEQLVKQYESEDVESTLTYAIPQTRRALIREANALMERIKVDYKAQSGLLSVIVPDAALINSYISVLSMHGDKSSSREEIEAVIFGRLSDEEREESLFETFNVTLNGHTCEVALEACSKMERSEQVYSFASRIWKEWIALGGTQSTSEMNSASRMKLGLMNSTISQVWSSMIRVLAKTNRLDEAMMLLRDFVRIYPPLQIASESATIFTSAKALTLPTAAAYPIAGPILTFRQIEALHMRLIEAENRKEDIRYLTWLMKAYEFNSRPKKPDILKELPIPISRQEAIRKLLGQGDGPQRMAKRL